MNDILKKVDDFYKAEIQSAKNTLALDLCSFEAREVITNAVQRCLGVALFAQSPNVPYDEIDALYTRTRIQLYSLLKEKE